MHYKMQFWVMNIVSTILRLFIIGKIGLTVDETHYWVYTKFLGLSYFDHPPFIAYLLKAATFVFGNNEFAVRFPSVFIFFFTSWIFFICVKKLYDEKTAFIGVLLLNILPMFSFMGLIALPDSPLALFWMLTLLIFIFITETNNKNYWYLLGVATGFAMLSKYNAILISFSIFTFLASSPKHRFWFKKKEPYFAIIIATLIFSPVLIWNIQNNWVSFKFQLNHGFGDAMLNFSFSCFATAIGAQAIYLSIFLFPLLIAAVILCIKETYIQKDRSAAIIACFSLPVLILFNVVAAFNEILPHWPAMGYLVLLIYASHLILKFWHIKWFRLYSYVSWAGAILLIAIAFLHTLYKIIPIERFLTQEQIEKTDHGISESERIDITNEVYGWQQVGDEIRKIVNAYSQNEKPFVFTHKSYLASELAAYIPELKVFCISDKASAYDIWQGDLLYLKNRNGLFVCNDYFFSNPKERYGDKVFSSYADVEEFAVYRKGSKIKKFFFTLCSSFNPSELPENYKKTALTSKKYLKQELKNIDYRIFKFINSDLKCKFLDYLMSPQSYCDSKNFNLNFIIILTISIVILWENKKEHFWNILISLAIAVATTAIIIFCLKHFFGRARPLSVFGDENVNILFEKIYTNSFPSGHSQLAFTVCAFMFITVRKYWYWYIIMVLAVSFERIYAGSHFPFDVLAGMIMGTLCSYIIATLFKNRK